MKKIIIATIAITASLLLSLLAACSEHSGHTITDFTGDYRFKSGVGEIFNCADRKRYFVAKSGAYKELRDKFKALSLKKDDDAYIRVKGYLKQQTMMDGIDPETVFVAVEFISFDKNRGCERQSKQGL